MERGESILNQLHLSNFISRLNSGIYSSLLLSDLKATKDFCHRHGVRFSDSDEITIVVDTMNRLYKTEADIRNAKALIKNANRNIRIFEKDMPRILRNKLPRYFRIVGNQEDRENNPHELDEYTAVKHTRKTRQKGYYSVPDNYYSEICSVKDERYNGTIQSLSNQLKDLSIAKALIADNSILYSDFDICLSSEDKKQKKALKKHIALHNRIAWRKGKLLSMVEKNIDDLHLKIGAYSWFRETSRVNRMKKKS
jgi:hypothetical protein